MVEIIKNSVIKMFNQIMFLGPPTYDKEDIGEICIISLLVLIK